MTYNSFPTPSGNIVIPCPENYSDTIALIKSDCFRTFGREVSMGLVIKKIICCDVLAWFRLCQIKDFLFPLKKRVYKWAARKRLISFPYNTKVGFGLYIGHSMGMVINGSAIIGNNVNLGHFITIGSDRGKAATIHDGVYVGPNVCLVEDVDLGFNASIGAGAVVVKSVQPNAAAVGNPAREVHIREKEPWNFFPLPAEMIEGNN